MRWLGNGQAGRGSTTGGRSDRRWVGNGQACKGFDDRWKVGQKMGRQRAGRQRFDDRWEVGYPGVYRAEREADSAAHTCRHSVIYEAKIA